MLALRGKASLPAILLASVLIVGAVVRFHFADANSYWLDELYSVVVYGTDNKSLAHAILRLTLRSIHPPLYQFILYNWMVVFGDSEVATRTLSNLYIVGATLCLYLSVRKIYGAWTGLAVALVFTLMYTPTYYALETRSYAQTIFLSCLSTFLLVNVLPRLATKSLRDLMRDWWLIALLAVNFSLLMTHYYNVLFLAAQGAFLIIYLLYRCERPIEALTKAVTVGTVPLALMLIVWLPAMTRSYGRRVDSYVVESIPMVPWEILSDMVIEPDFGTHRLYYAVIAIISLLALIVLTRLFRRPSDRTLISLWFLMAFAAPALLAFVLFLVSGHERYSPRYFSFCAGPLAALVVLGLYETIALVGRAVPLLGRAALPLAAVTAVLLAYPGGLRALHEPKADWRGIAQAIVDRVNQEPGKRIVVYETAFRKFPTLDYYLSRYSDKIRVHQTLRQALEKRDDPIVFSPPDADLAIVAFTHHRTSDFDKTLEVLNSEMDLVEEHLDRKGRGYLVFSVSK